LLAQFLDKRAHAFDSFTGMDEPTEKDEGHYPKGKLSVGGIEAFSDIMSTASISDRYYDLYEGFIPKCFESFPDSESISLGIVDVDQYAPTLDALKWVWPRLSYGGILVLDDYFPGRSILASAAIDDWLKSVEPINIQVIGLVDTQLIIRKTILSSLGAPYANFLSRK
jgi:O-methyltransferase